MSADENVARLNRNGRGKSMVRRIPAQRRAVAIEALRPWFSEHIRETDECIVWTGRVTTRGYGKRSSVLVHRASYEVHVGPIPVGLTIDHLCRNKPCCNPRHLEPVTREENHRRWAESLRTCRSGEHEFTPENTAYKSGRRYCRACRNRHRAELRRQGRVA